MPRRAFARSKARKTLGGEVTNDSDVSWWVSGKTNCARENFYRLGPGQNSDDVAAISQGLDGDVDAVWPNGRSLTDDEGEARSGGAFKLRDHRNTNIEGNLLRGHRITDYSIYYSKSSLPQGWCLPGEIEKTK